MLESLLNGGIDFTLFLQSLGDWLYAPSRWFSYLGVEEFYLLLLPILYLAIDRRLGLRVGIMLMVSGSLTEILKWLFHLPRPYWYDPKVNGQWAQANFGLPSGHAIMPTSVYGLIAARVKRNWYWALTLVVLFLIGLSRLILGTHFYFDVLAGWAVGFLLLWAFLKYEGRVEDWLLRRNLARQIGWIFLASLLLILVGGLALLTIESFEVPTDWVQNALADLPEEPIDPKNFETVITSAGTLFGLGAGAAWLNSRGNFSAAGPLSKRILRVLLGLAVVIVLWLGLKAIFPDQGDLLSYSLRYLRYGLMGLWVSALAPLLFLRFGLADRE